MTTPLILASASLYKRALLERLGIPFRCEDAAVDETPGAAEDAERLALRLARQKALAVAAREPGALVIGGDQVAALGDALLGKPGSHARAVSQLSRCSGQQVVFHTAVALARGEKVLGQRCVPTVVEFRALGAAEIERYVAREEPLDCAGSFRWERLGIALFRALRSADPTALEGLPLIALNEMLLENGVNCLLDQ